MNDKKLQKLIDYANEMNGSEWTLDELRNYSASGEIIEFYRGKQFDEQATQNLLIEIIRENFNVNVNRMLSLISELNSYDGSFEYYDYYENGEYFFETFYSGRIDEAVRASFYGDYRYMDDFVKINDYGNLTSKCKYELEREFESESFLDELTSYILENKRKVYFDEIDNFIEILVEEDEEDEASEE